MRIKNMTRQQLKNVIFCGSGFSKAIYNMPIQDALVEDLFNSDESISYKDYLPESLIRFATYFRDIELILSHYLDLAYLNARSKNRHAYKRSIVYIRMALAIYFREKMKTTGIVEYLNNKNIVEKYFRKMQFNTSDTIFITTNYDLGIEYLLSDIYGEDSYYYSCLQQDKSGKYQILKIHGSINWMEDRGNFNNSKFTSEFRNRKSIKLFLDELYVFPFKKIDKGFCLRYNDKKYTPLFIPFFYQKSNWIEREKNIMEIY